MSKVAIFLATGFEEIEALTVVDVLRRAKVSVDMISVTGDICVTSSHGITVKADKELDEVASDDSYDMLVLPGGMPGTKNLEACEVLMDKVDRYFKAGKNIAAICAAPTVFGHKGYLDGKKACCYPNMEDQLTGAKVSYESTVTDKNIITARGMGAAIDFSLAILDKLGDTTPSETIAKSIVYR